MERKFKEALSHRRSYYALSNKSLVSDEEIENIVKFAVKNIPSAFNSQSTRMVLLLGVQHVKLWNIVKDTLRKIVPAEAFKTTENTSIIELCCNERISNSTRMKIGFRA